MTRIILVDDDLSGLEMLRRGLEVDGHEVQAIGDSRDALAVLVANPMVCDLLITDISMPDIDGVSLVEEVLKLRSDLPVIMMSGLADELKRAEALKVDNVRMVSKPLSFETIRSEVQAVFG